MLSLFNFYKHYVFIFMLYFYKTQLVSNRYLHQIIKETEIASCIQAVSYCVCVCVCSFWKGSIVCFLYSASYNRLLNKHRLFLFL